MFSFRYSRWDGTQRVFDIDEEGVMEELSEELFQHGDVLRALRNLFQRGLRSRMGDEVPGLREMMEQLRQRRQGRLQQYNVDSVVEELKERLDKVVQTERQGIQRRLDEARQHVALSLGEEARERQRLMELLEQRAAHNLGRLDALPSSLGGALRELNDYDFMDPEAQRQFQELMQLLRSHMMEKVAQDLKSRIHGMTPEEMATLRQMLRELNQMLRDRMQGREPDFQGFMKRWGTLFGPDAPQSLDELTQQMQRQMAQAQSLLESMSPEQRGELEEALRAALDMETASEMAELTATLQYLYPMEELRAQYPFLGEESLTLEQAMELMGHLQSLDELERQLKEVGQRGNIQSVDLQKVEELLGEEACRNLEQLQKLAQQLEAAGYVQRKGERLELTPRGIRKLAQRALREVFSQLKKDRLGQHPVPVRGVLGEYNGETKRYEFGDLFTVDLERTVMNAVSRSGVGVPVRLTPGDFEVYRTEHVTQAATVLLLDQSRSMGLFGSFAAAKKVALALYALIQSQFPRDRFFIIGFSDYAVELKGEQLPQVMWNSWVSGANMHHAFMLPRKLLSLGKVGTKQIIMITDGEPTAHLEGDRSLFSYSPSLRTVQQTLREVRRCIEEGITINTFMLETTYYLLDFVEQMTRINKGRAFYTTPQNLGQYVLVDYFSNRRKQVS